MVFLVLVTWMALSDRLLRLVLPLSRELKWSCPSVRFKIVTPRFLDFLIWYRFAIFFLVLSFGIGSFQKWLNYKATWPECQGGFHHHIHRAKGWSLLLRNDRCHTAALPGWFLFKTDRRGFFDFISKFFDDFVCHLRLASVSASELHFHFYLISSV